MERKRFTRRGMLKLLSASSLAAWAGTVFPEFPLAKAAQASSGPSPMSQAMQSFVALDHSHPLLTAAMNTDGLQAIVAKHGRAALSGEGHAIYGDGSVQAVTMALKPSDGGVARAVYGFFRTANPSDIRIVQMELVIKQFKPFTGHAAFLDPNDRVVSRADFANGKLLSGAAQSGLALPGIPVVSASQPPRDFWGCLSWCLINTWPTLPWWLQLACGWTCSGCRAKFLPDCGACIGCIGGYASACIVWCSCQPWCPG
jgi:hypothetical protein